MKRKLASDDLLIEGTEPPLDLFVDELRSALRATLDSFGPFVIAEVRHVIDELVSNDDVLREYSVAAHTLFAHLRALVLEKHTAIRDRQRLFHALVDTIFVRLSDDSIGDQFNMLAQRQILCRLNVPFCDTARTQIAETATRSYGALSRRMSRVSVAKDEGQQRASVESAGHDVVLTKSQLEVLYTVAGYGLHQVTRWIGNSPRGEKACRSLGASLLFVPAGVACQFKYASRVVDLDNGGLMYTSPTIFLGLCVPVARVVYGMDDIASKLDIENAFEFLEGVDMTEYVDGLIDEKRRDMFPAASDASDLPAHVKAFEKACRVLLKSFVAVMAFKKFVPQLQDALLTSALDSIGDSQPFSLTQRLKAMKLK